MSPFLSNKDIERCKKKNRPTKVCWYLPIIPMFKRLFANAKDAKYLRVTNFTLYTSWKKMVRVTNFIMSWNSSLVLYPYFSSLLIILFRILRLMLCGMGGTYLLCSTIVLAYVKQDDTRHNFNLDIHSVCVADKRRK